MNIIAVFVLFVIPAIIGVWIYAIEHDISPPISNQKAKQRMRTYCVVLFVPLFCGWCSLSFLAGEMEAREAKQICRYFEKVECPQGQVTTIEYLLFMIVAMLLAGIPVFLLYTLLRSFFSVHDTVEKPKRKRNNAERTDVSN